MQEERSPEPVDGLPSPIHANLRTNFHTAASVMAGNVSTGPPEGSIGPFNNGASRGSPTLAVGIATATRPSWTAANIACMVNMEIQQVMAVMRQNQKWAVVPRYVEEELSEDPLLHDFKILRHRIFYWYDWRLVRPLEYLAPFLEVIRSEETSAPITGVALSSVFKIITYEIFDDLTVGAAETVHEVVAAVTSCRFEVTDPASEEVVLLRILQVLLACLRSRAGPLLSNSDVINIINTCLRVAFTKGELLQRTSCQIMQEMVRTIFGRLYDFEPAGVDYGEPTPAAHGPDLPPQAAPSETQASELQDLQPAAESALAEASEKLQEANGVVSEAGVLGNGESKEEGKGRLARTVSKPPPLDVASRTPSFTEPDSFGNTEPSSTRTPGPSRSPYSVPCLIEVFRFLCTLVVPDEAMGKSSLATHDAEEMAIFGLSLINAALEMGGPSFAQHPKLLALVKDDLFRALMLMGLSTNLTALALVSSIVLFLYQLLRTHLKLQLEAFFSYIIIKCGQGKYTGASYEQQEAALEILADFCRQPTFMVDMYANCDCDLTCSNTFEDLANLLSKSAFPVNSPLAAQHLLSLEGLLALVESIAHRADNAAAMPAASPSSLPAEEAYAPFWNAKCSSFEDPAVWLEFLRRRKYIKRRLMIGADHFNRDPKKGLEFLQGVRLLPEKLEPEAVASFFRMTPGLNKNLLGEYFGEPDQFNVQVLEAFANQFDFLGMQLDGALRTFLESFRLPGEAQKISRILEAFATRYYKQVPDVLANKDTAYVLAYSVIMLNTDQHNNQVKKKMTEEEFVRNNRKINDGKDLPREMLSQLYHAIAKNEIRMSNTSSSAAPEMTYSRWVDLIRRAKTAPPYICCDPDIPLLDRDMFAVIWGPTIAAISVVFDHAEDEAIQKQCIEGFLAVAKISAAHRMEDILDNLVVSLCKFTTLLNAAADKPALSYGEDTKAWMAITAVFQIANKHGDHIRTGWQNIVDCVIRLHKLGLLPSKPTSTPAGAPESAEKEGGEGRPSILANAAAAAAAGTQAMGGRRRSAGILSSVGSRFAAMLSLNEMGGEGKATLAADGQLAAHQRTAKMVEQCRIDDVFNDSKFLQADSLLQLVKALVWAGSRQSAKPGSNVDEEETAIFCLEILIAVTLRNRDRILLIWPAVHEHLASIVGAATGPGPLIEKSVLELLRVCQRLLPYKEDIGDELLRSLQLVRNLDARVADAYAERITGEVLQLVKSTVTYIRSPTGWKTVCSLLSTTARHPEAAEPGFEALSFIMSDPAHITPTNFLPCMEAALAFAEGRVGGVERSLKALDHLAGLSSSLGRWAKAVQARDQAAATATKDGEVGESAASTSEGMSSKEGEQLIDLWLRLAKGLRHIVLEQREDVRNHALVCLQRSLLQGEALHIPPGETWAKCFEQVVFWVLDELLTLAKRESPKVFKGVEGTLRRAVALLSRAWLQFITQIASSPSFGALWVHVLDRMEAYLTSGPLKAVPRSGHNVQDGTSLAENIPELLKNMLLVMSAKGILVAEGVSSSEGQTEEASPSLWRNTWAHPIMAAIQPSLKDELFPEPEPTPAPQEVPESPPEAPAESTREPGVEPQGDHERESTEDHPTQVPSSLEEAPASSQEALEAASEVTPAHGSLSETVEPVSDRGSDSLAESLGGANEEAMQAEGTRDQ